MPEFDPWKPVVIMGRAYRPAVPQQPTFFEQREINERAVAKLLSTRRKLGDRALKDSATERDENHTGVLDDSWYDEPVHGRHND